MTDLSADYRALVSKLIDAVESNRKIDTIKAIRSLLQFDIDIPIEEPRGDTKPRASLATASNIYNAFTKSSAIAKQRVKPPIYDEPTMADMLYSHIKSGKTTYEELSEPADSTEYNVVVWSEDRNVKVYRHFNKEDAYASAKSELIDNPDSGVYVTRVIAQPYTTVTMEEFK